MAPSKGYLKRRIIAALYFISLSIGWIFVSILFIWGQSILQLIFSNIPAAGIYLLQLFRFRAITTFLLLTAIFAAIYYSLTRSNISFRSCIKSAALVSVAWIIFSFAFSFYVQYISAAERSYSSIGLIMLFCIWLRSCILLFLCGGVVARHVL